MLYFFSFLSNIGITNQCRWISEVSESLLFVKYDGANLNIHDVHKKSLELKSPVKLDANQTLWIDVCPTNNNVLAAAGNDRKIKIYDRREAKIVETIGSLAKGYINCVRWNPVGDKLVTASADEAAALIFDFKTWKVLYTINTNDNSKTTSACFI